MKKYKVTIYQMGMPATVIIIETARHPTHGENSIYFLNEDGTTLASFPISITSIQLTD